MHCLVSFRSVNKRHALQWERSGKRSGRRFQNQHTNMSQELPPIPENLRTELMKIPPVPSAEGKAFGDRVRAALKDEGEMAEELIELREAHGVALLMLGSADHAASQKQAELNRVLEDYDRLKAQLKTCEMHAGEMARGADAEHEKYLIEKGLVRIYDAERDAALKVLAELNFRVHSGYDFNADPDSITALVGAALGRERFPAGWAAGAGAWRGASVKSKEANAELMGGTLSAPDLAATASVPSHAAPGSETSDYKTDRPI